MDIWEQILELDHDVQIQSDEEEMDCTSDEEEREDDDGDQDFAGTASFGLLKDRYVTNNKAETTPSCIDDKPEPLSTDEIIKLAGARIIESLASSSENVDVLSILDNPFKIGSPSSDVEGLSEEEVKNVDLMEYLLASAENYGRGNYNRALSLLDLTDGSASQTGTPIQRTAYFFSKALRLRMANTNTNTTPFACCPEAARNAVEVVHSRVPFSMASQLAAVQAIVENVVGEKRIHVVDLKIRTGLSIIALMQALSGGAAAMSPLELLKVTAVASNAAEERSIVETGVRLSNFARGMRIPFLFKVAKEDQSTGLHKSQVELEPKEALVVYSEYAIGSLIAKPSRLDAMMKFLSSIHPRVMVIIETEANHNSPDFGHRFVEALFTAAARFDCMAECMGEGAVEDGGSGRPSSGMLAVEGRTAVESIYINEMIKNVVVAEGDDRVIRDVRIEVWRKYFARCRMLEIQLSKLALNHAKIVVSRFHCAASCLVRVDKKSLLLGWKDTPLVFVSAWKFVGPKRKPRIVVDDTTSLILG
ncbi:DELLA protein 1 [Linum grandiflorum]